PRVGRCRLRDLVHVRRRRNSGADVKELPDSRLGGEVPDAAEQKTAVLLRTDPDGGKGLLDFIGGAPVGGEIVLSAQQVVVHPRGRRAVLSGQGRLGRGVHDVLVGRRPLVPCGGHVPVTPHSWRRQKAVA